MDTGEQVARPGMMEWLSNFLRSDNTGGVFYGWWLVAIGVLIILVGREIGEAIGRTAYMARLHDHVGIEPPWNVAAIAGGVIIWIGSMWAAGRGADRLGPRRMVQIGLPLAGLPILFAALPVPGSMQFALPAMAAIALIGAYLPTVSVLNHWFRDRLALALSLTLFGVAVGRVVFDWLLSVLLLVVDWQPVTVVTGAVIVVVAFPLALLIRNRPEEWGERPDGMSPAPAGSIPDYSWREAMRSRQFWMLAAAGAGVGSAATIGSVYAWQVASQGSATFEDIDKLGSFETLTSMAGILIGGLLSYRFPVRFVLAGAGIVQTVGVALLLAGYGASVAGNGRLTGSRFGDWARTGNCRGGHLFWSEEFRDDRRDVAVPRFDSTVGGAARRWLPPRLDGRLHPGSGRGRRHQFDWRRLVPGVGPAPVIALATGRGPSDQLNRAITSSANSASVSDGAGFGKTTKKYPMPASTYSLTRSATCSGVPESVFRSRSV